ncbi:MAG: prepilin-type N-terminal cleavage/methylation domain-containing protein [Magnetococcales bacterium]|nr:prepilin-type N-terminal cleavage/methylation domain-containing protein [Magnetococcales bacterium]
MKQDYCRSFSRRSRRSRRRQYGFTLIELMIVIAIIAALAAIKLPDFNKSMLKAKATVAIDGMREIVDAIRENYVSTNVPYDTVTYTLGYKLTTNSLQGIITMRMNGDDEWRYLMKINADATQMCIKAEYIPGGAETGTVQPTKFILRSMTTVSTSRYWKAGRINDSAFISNGEQAQETELGDCQTLGIPSL